MGNSIDVIERLKMEYWKLNSDTPFLLPVDTKVKYNVESIGRDLVLNNFIQSNEF